ncbi:MAG TPA: hypothetical protein VH518_22825 [Tepidisphaeraceae bacterium]|jgi:uncharacterized membrane protein YkoI
MKKYWVIAVAVLLASGCAAMMATAGEDKKDEQKIKFSDAPAAVQATLNKESGGAKIDTVDAENEDGKTIYEADAKIDGKNWEIKVAEDGKLISKKLDEEGEGGEKDHEGKEKDKD